MLQEQFNQHSLTVQMKVKITIESRVKWEWELFEFEDCFDHVEINSISWFAFSTSQIDLVFNPISNINKVMESFQLNYKWLNILEKKIPKQNTVTKNKKIE